MKKIIALGMIGMFLLMGLFCGESSARRYRYTRVRKVYRRKSGTKPQSMVRAYNAWKNAAKRQQQRGR